MYWFYFGECLSSSFGGVKRLQICGWFRIIKLDLVGKSKNSQYYLKCYVIGKK